MRWRQDGPDYDTGGHRSGGIVEWRIAGWRVSAWHNSEAMESLTYYRNLESAKRAVEKWLARRRTP